MGVDVETKRPGDGTNYPNVGDTVEFHYIASLKDGGVVVQSSHDNENGKPVAMKMGATTNIKGLNIGLLRMTLRETAIIRMSSDFAYGASGKKEINVPPNADLEFEVDLLKIHPAQPARMPPREPPREPYDRYDRSSFDRHGYDRHDRDMGASSSFSDSFRKRATPKEPAPKKEPEPPKKLWEIPKEERVFVKGVRVKIDGLKSDSGKKLNGKLGEIVEVLEIQGRYQVKLDKEPEDKSFKPENVFLAGPDELWSRGDLARIVASEGEDVEHDGSLCFLLKSFKKKDDDKTKLEDVQWSVDVNGTNVNGLSILGEMVKCKNLRVCAKKECDDPRGILSWSWSSIILLGFCMIVTIFFLLGTGLTVIQVTAARIDQNTSPCGIEVAMLALGTPMFAVVWVVGAFGGGYVLHEPIRDPRVYFLPMHHFGIGVKSARSLSLIACVSIAMLLSATMLLHQELVLPHLPGGRTGQKGTEFILFGLAAAAGVAVQGVFPWEVKPTWTSYIHLSGYLVFLVAIYLFMRGAGPLYTPELYPPTVSPDEQNDELSEAVEAASSSKLLQHQFVQKILWVRHDILMRLPPAVLVFPLMVRLMENSGKKRPFLMRNALGLAQWLAVLNFAAVFLSYGPEIAVAALLPRPSEDPLGGFS